MPGPDRTFKSAWKRLVHNWRMLRAAKAVSKAGAILKRDGQYVLAYQAYSLAAQIGQED